MIWIGLIILVASSFVAAYMLGLVPSFLGSVPVSERTGMWIAAVAASGVIAGLVMVMVGLVI